MKRLLCLCAALVAAVILFTGSYPRSAEREFFVPYVPVQPRTGVSAPVILAEAGRKKEEKKMKLPAWMRQCEYSWDCDHPMECCEFVGASFCCAGGIGIPSFSPQPVPIPIP